MIVYNYKCVSFKFFHVHSLQITTCICILFWRKYWLNSNNYICTVHVHEKDEIKQLTLNECYWPWMNVILYLRTSTLASACLSSNVMVFRYVTRLCYTKTCSNIVEPHLTALFTYLDTYVGTNSHSQPQNDSLIGKIRDTNGQLGNGGVRLSEFPLQTKPMAHNSHLPLWNKNVGSTLQV